MTAKHVSVTGAWRIVDTALELTGGGGIFKRDRIEQLFPRRAPGADPPHLVAQ